MGEAWFWSDGEQRKGPVDAQEIRRMVADGRLAQDAPVWKEGLSASMPAGAVASLVQPSTGEKAKGVLASLGTRISSVAGVPEIEDVPVGQVLTGGGSASDEDAEEIFAVGTARTTPPLAEVAAGWPRPRVWWRILLGALAAFLLLRLVMFEFDNALAGPGLVVMGGFMVPLAVVVFFLELNTPRNVSAYQVGRMTLLGGALALVVTMFLALLIPGSGTVKLLPALLTGVIEETAKALALLLALRNVRWTWQLNGLLFGSAVGAGFAGFESAGYAAHFGVEGTVFWRSLLAPGGHVIWTAMIGAALWQVRGARAFEWDMLKHPVVLRRWAVAVVLHGLWDAEVLGGEWWLLQCLLLLAIGWYLVFGILKQALAEVAAAKAGATPPAAA
jgi:RsiW-degrading membrane proteinase PrsW (M82 family)